MSPNGVPEVNWKEQALDILRAFITLPAHLPDIQRELTTEIGTIVGWVAYLLASVANVVARPLADGILRAFTVNRETWAGVMAAFVHELTGQDITAGELASTDPGAPLVPFLRAFGASLGDTIFSVIAPDSRPTPEDGKVNAEALFALTSKFGLQAWYGGFVGELLSLGQVKSMGQLPAAVEAAFGLSRITRLALRPAVQAGIVNPLTEFYNRTYTPADLSAAEAVDAWQQELIDDDALVDRLRGLGYSYEKTQLLLNVRQQALSLDQAAEAYKTELLDAATLAQLVRHHGFGATRADLVTQLLLEKRVTAILDELASTARTQWRSGQVSDDELHALLRLAHWREEEIALVMAHDELARRGEKQLTPTQLLDALEKGAIDEVTLRSRLAQQHYADEDVDILMAIRTKGLTAAQVLDARIRGRITDQEATERLERLGYQPADVRILLDLRTKRLTAGQVLDAFARGLLNLDTARADLIGQGYSEEVTDLLLSFQRKTLSVADVQEALLRGIVSEDAALGKLLELGYSLVDADLLLRLRFRLLTRGAILDAYEAQLVSRADAAARLLALGFTADESELLLRTTDAKVARTGKRAPVAPTPTAGS